MRFLLDALRRRRPAPVTPPPPAAVPRGWLVYAVADIHGEAALLDRMLDTIHEDAAGHPAAQTLIVFLGDYVDRGPDSRGVLNRLTSTPLKDMKVHFLMGNHEAAMLDFLNGGTGSGENGGAEWLRFGGVETLASYGISAAGAPTAARLAQLRDDLRARLPTQHSEFLQSLELSCVTGGYAFVHAGIRPGRSLGAQIPEDLLWIREPFLSDPRPHDYVIIHGHTVTPEPQRLPNRIGLDTGAYATGVLTALRLEGTEQRFLQVRR